MKLTADAEAAIKVIKSLGGRPLLVGGCVRDHFLGLESKDIDIEVHGPVTPQQVRLALAEVGRVDAVGMSFGVLKFGRDVDVSFPRRDSKTGAGHCGFKIEVDQTMTVQEALSRRDFTINSIAMDPTTGVIEDPFGGMADLTARVIRHTSDAFADDPLRVVRAIQFSARLDFDIAPETQALCRELAPRIAELSVERLWAEWEKILTKGQKLERIADAVRAFGLVSVFPGWLTAFMADDLLLKHPDLKGERRARMILGAQFEGRPAELAKFLKAIDAPIWLRRDAKLLATRPDFDSDSAEHQARLLARHFQSVSLRDALIIRRGVGGTIWESAEAQGILEAPLPPFLNGDHLAGREIKPGPIFGVILKAALVAQDRQGWTTKRQAREWFETHRLQFGV